MNAVRANATLRSVVRERREVEPCRDRGELAGVRRMTGDDARRAAHDRCDELSQPPRVGVAVSVDERDDVAARGREA